MNINNTLSTPTSNTGVYLSVGAAARQGAYDGQGWRPIGTAPKDGTIIEIRCTYGVAPWYGIFIWKETVVLRDNNGESFEVRRPGWRRVGDDSSSFEEGPSFAWRPYRGSTISYVDPTGGAQDSPAYWRGAAAASQGLPLDIFEKLTQRNAEKAERKVGFWDWFFRW